MFLYEGAPQGTNPLEEALRVLTGSPRSEKKNFRMKHTVYSKMFANMRICLILSQTALPTRKMTRGKKYFKNSRPAYLFLLHLSARLLVLSSKLLLLELFFFFDQLLLQRFMSLLFSPATVGPHTILVQWLLYQPCDFTLVWVFLTTYLEPESRVFKTGIKSTFCDGNYWSPLERVKTNRMRYLDYYLDYAKGMLQSCVSHGNA